MALVISPGSSLTPLLLSGRVTRTAQLEAYLLGCPSMATRADDQGMTPVMAACALGHRRFLRLLLHHQPPLVALDHAGRSCLHHLANSKASTRTRLKMATMLLDAPGQTSTAQQQLLATRATPPSPQGAALGCISGSQAIACLVQDAEDSRKPQRRSRTATRVLHLLRDILGGSQPPRTSGSPSRSQGRSNSGSSSDEGPRPPRRRRAAAPAQGSSENELLAWQRAEHARSAAAYRRWHAAQQQEQSEQEHRGTGTASRWNRKLADAFADDFDDMRVDPFGAMWYPDEASGDSQALQAHGGGTSTRLDALSEQEYCEFIYTELNRRNRQPWQEYMHAGATQDELEAERRRREWLAQENSRRLLAEQQAVDQELRRARLGDNAAAYAVRSAEFFDRLNATPVAAAGAESSDVAPWQIGLADVPWPGTAGPAVGALLFTGLMAPRDDADARIKEERKLLRLAQRRWHPDKWEQLYLQHVRASEREAVLARVQTLSQLLNQMVAERDAALAGNGDNTAPARA